MTAVTRSSTSLAAATLPWLEDMVDRKDVPGRLTNENARSLGNEKMVGTLVECALARARLGAKWVLSLYSFLFKLEAIFLGKRYVGTGTSA
mmetsp:Transcript_12679/g.22592  ORF Transcript_12679/g.22592 Transcript_12679/m.22592 type:complete len:91 (+) Transcript_12679:1033-1305(+)